MERSPFVSGNLIFNRHIARMRPKADYFRLVVELIQPSMDGYSVVATMSSSGYVAREWLFDDNWEVVG